MPATQTPPRVPDRFVPREIDDLSALLRHRARCSPNKIAYRFLRSGQEETANLTYRELLCDAERVAGELQARIGAGQPVLMVYDAGLDFVIAFFGAALSGNIAVPVALPRRSDRAQAFCAIAMQSGTQVALTTATLLDRKPQLAADPALSSLTWIHTDHLLASGASRPLEPVALDGDAVALLQYTSGSTGSPKGTVVTHGNILHNGSMGARALELTEDSLFVSWLPHFHDMGLIGNILQPFYVGGASVLMPSEAFVQWPERWLDAISRFRATVSGAPNFAYQLCVDRIEAPDPHWDLSSWELAYVGAEPVRAGTLRRFAAKFAPSGFRREALYPCYGLAEATLLVTGGRKGEALATSPFIGDPAGGGRPRQLVGCGYGCWSTEVAIIDPDTGEPVPDGAVGEVWLRGPSVARGYWKDPAATAETFVQTPRGVQLRTGDLGYLEDGQLYIAGRRKNLIIAAGRNFYAEDVQAAAAEATPPSVIRGTAAFAVDDERGERVVLVCELAQRHPGDLDLDTLADRVRQAVWDALGLAIHTIAFARTSAIPRTTSGKTRHLACRALFVEGALPELGRSELPGREIATSGGELLDVAGTEGWLLDQIAARLRVCRGELHPGTPFASLGLESRDLVALGAALSDHLGRELDASVLWQYPSVSELVTFLREQAHLPGGATRRA